MARAVLASSDCPARPARSQRQDGHKRPQHRRPPLCAQPRASAARRPCLCAQPRARAPPSSLPARSNREALSLNRRARPRGRQAGEAVATPCSSPQPTARNVSSAVIRQTGKNLVKGERKTVLPCVNKRGRRLVALAPQWRGASSSGWDDNLVFPPALAARAAVLPAVRRRAHGPRAARPSRLVGARRAVATRRLPTCCRAPRPRCARSCTAGRRRRESSPRLELERLRHDGPSIDGNLQGERSSFAAGWTRAPRTRAPYSLYCVRSVRNSTEADKRARSLQWPRTPEGSARLAARTQRVQHCRAKAEAKATRGEEGHAAAFAGIVLSLE